VTLEEESGPAESATLAAPYSLCAALRLTVADGARLRASLPCMGSGSRSLGVARSPGGWSPFRCWAARGAVPPNWCHKKYARRGTRRDLEHGTGSGGNEQRGRRSVF
jgi:hypothetical protein